ncbi:TatD family hydrolase [Vibrio gallicus]|uniref:TatD family hydrolase n=1 Tax=Vibrio gallicus TaxID=190897 RepID=UPI0021C3DC80|nr:TatD family hydrolase [Vibrio gallicus]
MWFDTHCHLDFDCFQNDWQNYLQKFEQAQVTRFLVPSIGSNNWGQVLELAQQPKILAGVGIHPQRVLAIYKSIEELHHECQLLAAFIESHGANIAAIGECGLDKRYKECLDKQVEVFEFQLQLASLHNKPIVVHSVKQHHQVLSLLNKHTGVKGVIHGFSGNYQQAKAFYDIGMKLGVGSVITRPSAHRTRDALARLPLDALVLETDAPDMPLHGYEGGTNSPHYLPHIFLQLVKIRSENTSILAKHLWRNSNQLFASL